MEFNFGIPSQRGKTSVNAIEFYANGPGLIILQNAGPRTSKNMVLNQQACETLGLEDGDQIAFDFTKSTPILVNATGLTLPKGAGYIIKSKKEYKGLTFKDSKLWGYFVKTYNLDETDDTIFTFNNIVGTDPVAVDMEQLYVDDTDSNELILDSLKMLGNSNEENDFDIEEAEMVDPDVNTQSEY